MPKNWRNMPKHLHKNKKRPCLSVLYVYFNTPEEIKASIGSLKSAAGGKSFEVIVVDNNSHVPLALKKTTDLKIIKNKKNLGYGSAINQAAKRARGKYLLISNTDTVYPKDSIKRLIHSLEKEPKTGIVGPKMVDDKKETLLTKSRYPLFPLTVFVYSGLRSLPLLSKVWNWFHYAGAGKTDVDTVGGASMLVSKDLFEKVGGFDSRFFMFFEEADLCKRVKEAGFKVRYLPGISITHSVGKSLKDKEKIRQYYELSRFRFVQKYQGTVPAVLSEAFIKLFSFTSFSLMGIFVLSLFVNLNRITSLMMFFGDFGRDMLVARDMVLTGSIPLLGIPSSVVWLSQGPLSIYLIGLSFLFGGFAPWVPAVFYGVLGSLTMFLIYTLGKIMFNKYVGLLSALFFAASPFVIVNARMPYHTAPIPFFSALFFISLYSFIKSRSVLSLLGTGFFLGLLFQLELSNGVLFFLIALIFWLYKVKLNLRSFSFFVLSFAIGILPFIIYDLTHRFTQTLGFAAWVLNRIRLFFGLTVSGNSTTVHAPDAVQTIWDNLVRFVFPVNEAVSGFIIFASIAFLIYGVVSKRKPELFLGLCLAVPFVGFVIHARPGMAYFPLVFPLLSLLIALLFYRLIQRLKLALLFFVFVVSLNILFTTQNFYFLNAEGRDGGEVPGWRYGLGIPLSEQEKVIGAIQKDANNKEVLLVPGGFLKDFKTSIDNYHYIAWFVGLREGSNGQKYVIFHSPNEVPPGQKIIYRNGDVTVIVYE